MSTYDLNSIEGQEKAAEAEAYWEDLLRDQYAWPEHRTRLIIGEVKAIAMAWSRVLDMLSPKGRRTTTSANYAGPERRSVAGRHPGDEKRVELYNIQRDLLNDLGLIGALVNQGELRQASKDLGWLMVRCDDAIQSAPVMMERGLEETEKEIRRLQAQVDAYRAMESVADWWMRRHLDFGGKDDKIRKLEAKLAKVSSATAERPREPEKPLPIN